MTLTEFRATRRLVPLAQAKADMPFLTDMDYPAEYDSVLAYADGAFILTGCEGHYLHIEADEYTTRDLPALEFILWLWVTDTPESLALRTLLWG